MPIHRYRRPSVIRRGEEEDILAQIVFIINDDGDGVNITAAAEPPIPEDITEGTPAQAIAHLVANVVTAALSAPEVIEDEEDPNEGQPDI